MGSPCDVNGPYGWYGLITKAPPDSHDSHLLPVCGRVKYGLNLQPVAKLKGIRPHLFIVLKVLEFGSVLNAVCSFDSTAL